MMVRQFHDSLFTGHLGISRTVLRIQTRVYWPGLHQDVRTYVASCTVCIARAPMGHVVVGRRCMGEGRHGLIKHINYIGKGEPLCVGDGGLLLSVDGGLSTS